ncbi:D-2-hydroxyacid dehydrogenase [Halorussus gelatinilyticus]|uniref:D-2-hydroxyacid dehydrogenase n=1 Tax=Halorussus gelatinilyticus TaxID=2937524 RepID=A0A8U0IL25_9EURY|nr:D-2-hydroxyacid dehydrogenase [Halorussus gelatinilyticus]UPW00904.1 D-2-hydroxyacid dehydrogenase [Halorussus gelatinilyticus]
MTDEPTVLIPHYVSKSARDGLSAELADLRPDLYLSVAATPPETDEQLSRAEVVLTGRFPAEKLDAAPELEWVQALSAGVDSFDREALSDAGVALTSASGIHAEPIGEQVLAYLLTFERNVQKGMNQKHRGVWENYGGRELRDETVGILGLGAIGGRVAELASAFGTRVVGTKRNPESAPDAVDEAYGPDGLYDVLAQSDYVVVAVPLTDETRGLVGEEEIRTMQSSAVLVNVARGEIVDEAALTTALQQGHLRGAALDVFEEEPLPAESPLWDLSNVVITPHMAGSTPHYYDRCASLFAENYEWFVAGELDAIENRMV